MATPDYIYKIAWQELYKTFGENLKQPELDLMDGVLASVITDEKGREITKERLGEFSNS